MSSSSPARKRWSAQMMLPATKRARAGRQQQVQERQVPSEEASNEKVPSEDDEFDHLFTDAAEIQELLAAEDTESAIELLRRDCPVKEIHPNMPSIIMVHHLYPLVPDRTLVDRQLEEYRKQKKIIKLKIGASPDEFSIIVMQEYLQQITMAKARFEEQLAAGCERGDEASGVRGEAEPTAKKISSSLESQAKRNSRVRLAQAASEPKEAEVEAKNPAQVFDSLANLVEKQDLDVSVGKDKLLGLLGCDEQDITTLIRSGFLLIKDAQSYWFSCPYSGLFLQNVVKGRKEILALIRRKQFHEILESVLVRKRLRKSVFRIQYLLEDLTASGALQVVKTTSGNLLRLRK